MHGAVPPELQNIIMVAGEIAGVKPNQQADTFDKRGCRCKARAVEELALHVIHRELKVQTAEGVSRSTRGTLLTKAISLFALFFY